MQPQQKIIPGPDRKYPQKTFASGGDGAPNTVLEELHQIPNYLDYTVFSKNQLRFAEKVFKTNTYVQKEDHIRGKNMFLKLNKPQYWNKTNIYLLFDSIHIILQIEYEILQEAIQMKINSNPNVQWMGREIIDVIQSITNYFTLLRKQINATQDLIGTMKEYTDAPYIVGTFLSTSNGRVQGSKILALGVVLATYAKIVSILTYVNPYVLVRKDSGVDTIKAPKVLYDAVVMPEGQRSYTGRSVYEGYDPKPDEFNYDHNVKDVQMKNLNPHETIQTGERIGKSKTYSKNPIIRLKQYPMYSLDILFPLKISPYIVTEITQFESFYGGITPMIVPIKLLCSILKISFDGVLSKFHTCDAQGTRIKPSYSLKNVNGKKQFSLTLHRTKNTVNVVYMRDVLDYSSNRAYCSGVLIRDQNNPANFYVGIDKMQGMGRAIPNVDAEATKKQIYTNPNYNDYLDPNVIISNPDDLVYAETDQTRGDQQQQQQQQQQQPGIKQEN